MATKAKTISARAITIAAIGSLALGGAQVVAPAGSVLAAGVNEAVAQEALKPGVSTADVKYLGIFDANGKVAGPFESSNYNKSQNSNGRVVGLQDGYQIRGEFSLANANPGDTLRLTPRTEFTLPNGKETASNHAGMRVSQTSEWSDVEHDGVVIGQYRTVRSGSIELKFSDAVADVKSGTVTLSAPVQVWDFYISPSANGYEGDNWDGKGFSNPAEATANAISTAIPKGGDGNTATVGTIGTVRFLTVTSSSTKNSNRAYESNAIIVDNENFTVRRTDTTLEMPAGANGTLVVNPNVDHPRGADWYLADDINLVPTVRVFGKAGTDEEYESSSMSYEDAQKQFPGLKIEAEKTGRGVTVTTSNVPENVKPYVSIRRGPSGTVGYGTYVEGGSMFYAGEFNGTINGEQVKRTVSNTVGSMAAIPGQPSVAGLENAKRTGDLSGSIAGQPTGLGVDGSVAPIGGTKQTFQFFIKNTGDAPLVAPIVTLPNGKQQAIKNVAIAPNGTGSFSVYYDVPAGNGALNFDVSLSRATLSPSNTVSFRYSQSALSDSVKDSFGYPTEKPVTVEQEKTVKSPAPKDAPKDTKYRIDRTANPNLTWATVDPNTGVVTLSPSASVVPGNYEVPVEATFPDNSKRTITLPVVVTGEDPADRVKDLENEVADLQKQLDAEKAKGNADREKIAKLETELKAAKDALKVAQDAAKAAQDSANNAQDTANQALKDLAKERERVDDLTKRADKAEKDLKDARERVAALEKENDAQQKQIDQARKDVKDLQGKTKQLRTDLEAAKKRVTALEEQNKKQQGQIDALVKENKTQQSQIDALKKQNGEQQKQIDGLKAGLRDANKKITALETDLALTKIELAEVSGRLAEVEGRLNTGLGKCVGTIGGSLAALVPAVILASQFTGGTNIPQVDNSIAQFQRQLGMFNPQLAQVVNQNRGAIAAGLAGLGLLSLVLLPGTCGDASLGEAAVEPLSSELAARKAARENGEGGSSLKVGADVAAGEGATGSSEQ